MDIHYVLWWIIHKVEYYFPSFAAYLRVVKWLENIGEHKCVQSAPVKLITFFQDATKLCSSVSCFGPKCVCYVPDALLKNVFSAAHNLTTLFIFFFLNMIRIVYTQFDGSWENALFWMIDNVLDMKIYRK